MEKLKAVSNSPGQFLFYCPGCENHHAVYVEGADFPHKWQWNGSMDKPTFSPSLLLKAPMWIPPVTGENYEEFKKNPWTQTQVETICHSFIKDGMIQFLGDCTHHLKGQTVEIPDFK
jgi:hypothetical protein